MRNLKRALSLTLASVMLLGMMVVGSSAAAGYSDVDAEDNVEAIEVLQAVEVMVGDDRGFGPDRPVTRAEMAVVMGKLLSLDYNYYVSTCPFADVSGNFDWAKGWVGACAANGIVSGRGDGIYDPAATVTAVEAASMMMRALGYFRYQNDYADGFMVSTVRQGTKIGIFEGVGTDAATPMTRNQVAQMALNALKSGMVEPDGNTINLTTPDGAVFTGKVNYVFVTSAKPYATAISPIQATAVGSQNGGPIVELGEQLYNGDLKLYDNRDDEFGRPSRTWEYDGKEIGTYMKKELIRAEYTTAINGKTLYELLGKSVIEDNYVEYFLDGRDDATIKAENMVRGNTKDYATTGKGVLTQVFFDPDREEITIASIDTFLADVDDDYNEAKAELTVDIHANTSKGNDTKVTLDEVANIEGYKDGDKILVQVAWDGQSKYEIVRVMDPTSSTDVTLNKYSKESYVVTEGTQYDYAANGRYSKMGALDELTSEGSYGDLQLADYTYNLWFDQYGYLIGNVQVEADNHYVFITGYDFSGSHTAISHATASAIFTDGTMENITVDVSKTQEKIELYNHLANGGTVSDLSTTPKFDPKWYYDFDSANGNDDRKSEYNMWFTYTTAEKNGGTVYTLTPVNNWVNQEYDNNGKVNSYTLRTSAINEKLAAAGGGGAYNSSSVGLTDAKPGDYCGGTGHTGTHNGKIHWAVGDEDSVYLTVDTKDVTSGTARGISKVNGVFTGVQDVDIEVLSKTNNKLDGVNRVDADPATKGINTDASVFAVADDNNYIVAAVVIGKDTASTKNYGYILGDAEDETYEKEGNYHYWSFEGVLNGKIETLTIRKNDVDEFKTLRRNIQSWMSTAAGNPTVHTAENGFVEFEFDKDGYIIDAKRITETSGSDNVYGEYDFGNDPDPDDYKTYLMAWGDNNNGAPNRTQNLGTNSNKVADFGFYSSQYTLHAGKNHPTEAGLTLAKDGTVVVVETEVYTGGEDPKVVWTQFSDVKKAIEYLEKSDENNHVNDRAEDFTGWVAGPLNSKGTAQWLVLNTNQTKTVVTDGGGSKNPGTSNQGMTVIVEFSDGTNETYKVAPANAGDKTLKIEPGVTVDVNGNVIAIPEGKVISPASKTIVYDADGVATVSFTIKPDVAGQPATTAGMNAAIAACENEETTKPIAGAGAAISLLNQEVIENSDGSVTVKLSGTAKALTTSTTDKATVTAMQILYWDVKQQPEHSSESAADIMSLFYYGSTDNSSSMSSFKMFFLRVEIEGQQMVFPIFNDTPSTQRVRTVNDRTYIIDFSGVTGYTGS